MTAEQLVAAAGEDALGRLRWLALRLFRVPPGSADDMTMSDGAVLWAAANMVLDAREGGVVSGAHFDEERFRALKEGEHGA